MEWYLSGSSQVLVETVEQWFPVAPSALLVAGHTLFAAYVQGRELVLWRSQQGIAQAWENRCPHRSVRLSMGQVLGNRLSCAYHGWQFEAGTGACVAIPAHPEMAAPGNVRVYTWQAFEHQGMVWVSDDAARSDGKDAPAAVLGMGQHTRTFSRTLTLRTSLRSVQVFLGDAGWRHEGMVWRGQVAGLSCEWLLLEAREELTFAHVWLAGQPEPAMNKAFFAGLRQLREQMEVIRHA